MGIITDRDWVIDELGISGYEAVFRDHDDLNKDKITDIATIASYLYYCGCIKDTDRSTWNDMNYPGNAAFITRNAYKSLIEENASSLYAKMIISPFGNDNRLLSLKHITPGGVVQGYIQFNDSWDETMSSYVTSISIYCKNGVILQTEPIDNAVTNYKTSFVMIPSPASTIDGKMPLGKNEIDNILISHNGKTTKYIPTLESEKYINVICSNTTYNFLIQTLSINN